MVRYLLPVLLILLAIFLLERHPPSEECNPSQNFKEYLEYKNGTILVHFVTNCCGIEVDVKKERGKYVLMERRVGKLCKCFCHKTIEIKNAEKLPVEIFSYDGRKRELKYLGFCGWSTYGKCETDFDCVVDGCSGQVCRSKYEKPILTTCEWRECYDKRLYKASCRCIGGKCQWVE